MTEPGALPMTTPETTPSRLHALADDAEVWGEGCREYAQGLRAAAIELEAALAREGRLREALRHVTAFVEKHVNPTSIVPYNTHSLRAALGETGDD